MHLHMFEFDRSLADFNACVNVLQTGQRLGLGKQKRGSYIIMEKETG